MTDRQWQSVGVGGDYVEVRVGTEAGPRGHRLWPSIGEYPLYDDMFYSVMLADEPRNSLFGRAVASQSPGRAVLELGTGPDLLWSTLAAESGATSVVAVEVIEASAEAAAQRARALGEHVRVICGDAIRVRLESRADLCIAELVGAIGGSEGIAAVLHEAWQRHLAPDALVVPYRVRTPVAALSARELVGDRPSLHPTVAPYVEQVFRFARAVFDLRFCLTGLTGDDLVTTTGTLEDLRLQADAEDHACSLDLEATRPGVVDSLLLWLELQCAPDQPFLDSLETVTNWMPVLVPFADDPVPVLPGDRLKLEVTRTLPDGVHPQWAFTGAVHHRDGTWTPVRASSPYAPTPDSPAPFQDSWLHRAVLRTANEVRDGR